MFFAYDPGDEFETLEHAARRLVTAGLATSHRMRVYVLIGYPKDTFALAEARLKQMVSIGFTPMAFESRNADRRSWGPPVSVGGGRAFGGRDEARAAIFKVATDQPLLAQITESAVNALKLRSRWGVALSAVHEGTVHCAHRLPALDIVCEHHGIASVIEHAPIGFPLVPSQGFEDGALNSAVPARHDT
jgi:hypothetical protein